MKLIGLIFFLALSVYVLEVNADSCTGPNDILSCKFSECCSKKRFPRTGFECESKGQNEDDRCGGEYTCGCSLGLNCVADSGSFLDKFREGTGSCKRLGFIQG